MARILVIEDDLDVRDSFASILHEEGHEVVEARNGYEALAVLARVGPPPALILLDLLMPRMDGHAFLEALRADPSCGTLPVIVVSASVMTAPPSPWLQVLRKPIDLEVLLEAVERVVGPPSPRG